MRSRLWIPIFGACMALASPVFAQPVHVSITQPDTPMTDVLTSLAKESGATIVADSSVTSPIGVADLHADSVGAMLDNIKALDSALSWQKVYLPASETVPSGDVLEQEVMSLKKVQASDLVLPEDGSTVTYSKQKAAADTAPPAGMQTVYVVTERPQAQANGQAGASDAPVSQVTDGLSQAADQFGQLSPEEQGQALPLMFQQFQRIMQEMDPSVRAQLPRFMQGAGAP